MTDIVRSVAVRFSAETAAYLAKTRAMGAETEAVSNRMTKTVRSNSLAQERALKAVGTTAKYATGIVAFGLIAAAKESANFAEKMALVKTLSHATTPEMQQLSKAALTIGQNIGYSATQVADGEAEMIKAGVSLKDILGGGLKGALDLAAAGQTDVATATEIAASAMTQFRLKGKDIPHLADLLAAGADKALGSVTDLGDGLKQVGTTAHQMGLNVDETTGVLAAFAQAGLIGERGGTTFKQMLLQLASPTKQAAELMKKYGLSLYDAQGNIKSMPALADNLRKSFKNLDPEARNAALGIIFGSRAIQGANIFLADGRKGISDWIDKVNDQGFAAEQASGKLDSLKGDIKKLGAVTQSAFIELGDGSQSPLRKFVQNTTKEIEKLTKSGDLTRWSHDIADDVQTAATAAKPLAKALGGTLANVARDGKAIADAFNSLPKGVQQAIVTGGALAYGANKLGVLKPIVKSLTGKGAGGVGGLVGKAGVVPVFVTNKGFGAPPGGIPGAAGKTGAAAEGAAEGVGFFEGFKAILRGKKVPNLLENGGRLGALGNLAFSGMAIGDAGNEVIDRGLTKKDIPDLIRGQIHDKAAAARKRETAAIKDQVSSQQTLNKLLMEPAALPSYIKRLRSLPDAVQTKVETPGAIESLTDVRKLKRQYDLTPKQVRTLIALTGVTRALTDTQRLKRQLDGLHNKRVTVTVAINGASHAAAVRSQLADLNGTGADGATVPKTGKHYADRHLYMLADGEEVISNRYGQADRFRADKAAGRIPGYAKGGTAGGAKPLNAFIRGDLDLKMPRTLKQWQHALELSKTAIDNERSARDDLVSKRDDLSSSVTGSLTSDLFGGDKPSNWMYFSAADKQKYLQQQPQKIADADTDRARKYLVAENTLKANGLKGAAYEEVARSGNLEQLQALAAESKSGLAQFMASYNARAAATQAAGGFAGATVYNPQINETNRQLANLRVEVGRLTHQVKVSAAGHAKAVNDGRRGHNAHRAQQIGNS